MKRILVLAFFLLSVSPADARWIKIRQSHTLDWIGETSSLRVDVFFRAKRSTGSPYNDDYLVRWNEKFYTLSDAFACFDGETIPLEVKQTSSQLRFKLPAPALRVKKLRISIQLLYRPLTGWLRWYNMPLVSTGDQLVLRTPPGMKIRTYPGNIPREVKTNEAGDSEWVWQVRETHIQNFLVTNGILPDDYLRAMTGVFFDSSYKSSSIPWNSDSEPVRHLAEWIQDRFIARAYTPGHYIPPAAADILKRGEANCLDRVYIAVIKCREEGISAWPALVETTELFPSPDAFPHVILLVEESRRKTWYDLNGLYLHPGTPAWVLKPDTFFKTRIQRDDLDEYGEYGYR